jgi:hypothetical protein
MVMPVEISNFYYSTFLLISGIIDIIVLATIVFSTFKCIGFYGQGFKEMIQKQRILDTNADLNASGNAYEI